MTTTNVANYAPDAEQNRGGDGGTATASDDTTIMTVPAGAVRYVDTIYLERAVAGETTTVTLKVDSTARHEQFTLSDDMPAVAYDMQPGKRIVLEAAQALVLTLSAANDVNWWIAWVEVSA